MPVKNTNGLIAFGSIGGTGGAGGLPALDALNEDKYERIFIATTDACGVLKLFINLNNGTPLASVNTWLVAPVETTGGATRVLSVCGVELFKAFIFCGMIGAGFTIGMLTGVETGAVACAELITGAEAEFETGVVTTQFLATAWFTTNCPALL